MAQAQAAGRPLSCLSLPPRVSLEELRRRAAAARTANPVLSIAWELESGLNGAPYDWAEAIRFHRMVMDRSARFAAGTLGDINWRTSAGAIRRLHEKGLNGAKVDFAAIDAIYREEEARGLDVSKDRARTDRMKSAYDDYLRALDIDMFGGGSGALPLFRRAADAGIIDAMFNVGRYYVGESEAGSADWAEGKKWFERAAREGHDMAMYFLGGTLLQEADRNTNPREVQMAALRWFYQASLRDHSYAMMAMGLGHQGGMGTLGLNNAEAACWYRRAYEYGNDVDGSRDEARRLLDVVR